MPPRTRPSRPNPPAPTPVPIPTPSCDLAGELQTWLMEHHAALMVQAIQQSPFPLDISPALEKAGIRFGITIIEQPIPPKPAPAPPSPADYPQ